MVSIPASQRSSLLCPNWMMVISLKMEYYIEATHPPCLITLAAGTLLQSDREAYFKARLQRILAFWWYFSVMSWQCWWATLFTRGVHTTVLFLSLYYFLLFPVFVFALTSTPSLMNLQLADAILLCKKALLLFWPHFNKAKSGYDGKGLVKRSRKK